MRRARTLFAIVLPSALAGGLLFASAFGHAETGRDRALGRWPDASDARTGSVLLAQADPQPAERYRGLPPAPPAPPVPPVPPDPPSRRGHHRGRGMSVMIHDGKVEIDGIAELVQSSLEGALSALDHVPDVPPEARDRYRSRIRAVRDKINARLGRLKSTDLDRIGPEMERMGDEIEKEMEGLDKDLEQLGDKIGKNFAQKFGRGFAKSVGPSGIPGRDSDDGDDDDDDDDRDAAALPPGVDTDLADPADLGPAAAALKGLALDAGQREQLARLRAESDGQVASAKRELEQMSSRLHDTLLDTAASEADIARQIDSISAKEATIRKARILAWVKARQVLRDDQRRQVESAVKKGH